MIKLYGSKMTSAYRCHILLSEIGLDFEEIVMDLSQGEQKSRDFLKLNPNGKVPCLIDGDFALWESVAINSYLARKYKPELLGKTIEDNALIDQWSLWAVLNVQPHLFEVLILQDEELKAEARKALPPLHRILDDHLADRDYMLGDQFTLADINMGSVIAVNSLIGNDISEFARVGKWLGTIFQRPSFT
ncbi:MAG: glutathione S-transferase family protein [Proteobacteria bacterium]|nr:glutathione S-transferase family protein [Pseudomonadota bacterium]